MKLRLAILSLLLWAAPAWAVVTVKLPPTVQVKPGRLVKIQAESTGKVIRWMICSEDADLIPSESGKSAVFSSPTAGRYRVFAYSGDADGPSEPAICLVTVGEPPEPGPGPNPNPTPVPPDDPLAKALQAAFTLETDAGKKSQCTLLATLYKTAATSTVNDATLKTVGDLYQVMRKAAQSLIPDAALPKVRAAVAAELSAKLPKAASAPLDAATRALAGKTFAKVGAALEGVK